MAKTEKELKEVQKASEYLFKGINGNRTSASGADFLKFLQDQGKMALDMGLENLYGYTYENRTNAQRITEKYTEDELEDYKDQLPDNPPYIKVGTTIYLPNDKILVELQKLLGSDAFLSQVEFNSFWSEIQQAILKDPEYVPFDVIAGQMQYGNSLSVKDKALNVQVWLVNRAKNVTYDISAFVKSISTTKDFGVGSFTIELVPIEDIYMNFYGNEFAAQYSLLDVQSKLHQDWFTKFVQTNDMIFIRYERLQMEKYNDDLSIGNASKAVSPSAFNSSRIWDMIGLVDNVITAVDPTGNDYTVTINGQDLMKLFAEDGSYFIPLYFIEGSSDRWFYGGTPESGWFKRTFVDGDYDYYIANSYQTIESFISFVVNHLSNIKIVDDSVLESIAVRKEKYPLNEGEEADNKVHGIWQIVRVFIESILSDRLICDRTFANPEGTLMDFMNKVCQQPFVEFWGDTWKNEFDIIIRQPPFTKKAIRDVVDSGMYVKVETDDVMNMNLTFDERVYAWYRLMPQNSFMGNSQFSSLAFVPIIYLDKYCEMFGNKRCITNDIYLSEKSFRGKDRGKNMNLMSQALINDLLFVIETTAYFPFTRRGTITLNGDRRIKVGTFIRFTSTDELFYVTSVSNQAVFDNNSVDRTTTITVERGMFIENINGENNYFNIVDIDGIRKEIIKRQNEINEEEFASSPSQFVVNEDVFDYFMKRLQMK